MRTIKAIVVSCLAVLAMACEPVWEPIEPLELEEAEQVIEFYYQQPDVNRLLRALSALDTPEVYRKEMRAPLMGFFSALALERPEDWKIIQKGRFDTVDELNDLVFSVPYQKPILEKFLANPNQTVNNAEMLDLMWGAFSATGDTRFVQVVATTAQQGKNPIVKAAAEWSFNSQRKQHPVIEKQFPKTKSLDKK